MAEISVQRILIKAGVELIIEMVSRASDLYVYMQAEVHVLICYFRSSCLIVFCLPAESWGMSQQMGL